MYNEDSVVPHLREALEDFMGELRGKPKSSW